MTKSDNIILMPRNCYLKLRKIFSCAEICFSNLAKASACDSIMTSYTALFV